MIDRRRVAGPVIVSALLLGAAAPGADNAPGAASAVDDPKIAATPGLWRMTLTASYRAEPDVRQVCLSAGGYKPHYRTLGASCKTTRTVAPDGSIASDDVCTTAHGQQTDVSHARFETSPDGHRMHARIENTNEATVPGTPAQSWSESLVEYLGVCPVPMRPDQSVLLIGPDGKAMDPLAGRNPN
jgi:hypothetical protein